MQAYYDLMDDMKEYPFWQRKLQEDLGGSVSFLGIMMNETVREKHIDVSPIYNRFDMDK